MAQVTIKLDAQGAVAKLKQLQANIPIALQAAATSVLLDAQNTIIQGGAGWAPWKRPYRPPHQMEWMNGTMLRSLTVGGSGNIFQPQGDDTILIGSNVVYTAAQNFGDARHALPARPFFVDSPDRDDAAGRAFLAALVRGNDFDGNTN